MKENLVISAMGPDHTGLVNQLSAEILAEGASIDDSRMMILGGEFAIILMVSGLAEQIQNLKQSLPAVLDQLDLKGVIKSTADRQPGENVVPFEIDILAMDETGIVHTVSSFFAKHGVNIENLVTDTYSAPQTGMPMFSLKMVVHLPVEQPVSDIKDAFATLCDELFIDASMEPSTSLF